MAKSSLFLVLLAAVVISADLQSDVKEILDQFPEAKRVAASFHPAGPNARSVIDQSHFTEQFNKVLEIEEVKNVVEYFEKQGLDVKGVLFDFLSNPHYYNLMDGGEVSTEAILSHVLSALSKPGIAKLVEEKAEASPEFAKFAAALEAPQFKHLLYRALNAKTDLSPAGGNENGSTSVGDLRWWKIKVSFSVGGGK